MFVTVVLLNSNLMCLSDLKSCRLLEKMDLEECALITDQTLIHLAMGCPRLENLVSLQESNSISTLYLNNYEV